MIEKHTGVEELVFSPASQIEAQATDDLPKIMHGFLEILKGNSKPGRYIEAKKTFFTKNGCQIDVYYEGKVSDMPTTAKLNVVVFDGKREEGKIDCAFSVNIRRQDTQDSMLPNSPTGSISRVTTSLFMSKDAAFISHPQGPDGNGLNFIEHRDKMIGYYPYSTAWIMHEYRPRREYLGGQIDAMQVTESQPPGLMSTDEYRHEATSLGVNSFRHLATGLFSVLNALTEHQNGNFSTINLAPEMLAVSPLVERASKT